MRMEQLGQVLVEVKKKMLTFSLNFILNFACGTYVEDITWWREDMNFMFEWQEQYLTSDRSERVRYYSCHEPTCNVLIIIWRRVFYWELNHS